MRGKKFRAPKDFIKLFEAPRKLVVNAQKVAVLREDELEGVC